jgi:hypothetical protein
MKKSITVYPIPYSKLDTIPKVEKEILAFEKSVKFYTAMLSLSGNAADKKTIRQDLKNSKGILKALKVYLKKLKTK